MRRTIAIATIGLLGLTAACGARVPDLQAAATTQGSLPDTTSSTTTTTTTTEAPFVPEQLAGLPTRRIEIEDVDRRFVLFVAVASTADRRAQGLMNVADLQDLDGMLFVFEEPVTTTFWMKDVLMPLDIAFFAEDFSWVGNLTMPLCEVEECPQYRPDGPFMYAVEVPETSFSEMSPGATLVLDP